MAIAVAGSLHVGALVYLASTAKSDADGRPDGAIDVELMPSASEPADEPDDVAGPKVAGAGASAGEIAHSDDPDPPASAAPPPTDVKQSQAVPPALAAPPSPTTADAVLPPVARPEDRPPDPRPADEKTPDVEKDDAQRPTVPSHASNGSAASLEGGKRVSPTAKATWAGAVGTHVSRLRRYPREARAEGWQGTARVRVTIDGNGHVTERAIVKSSGRPILDAEALALMGRSDPFPKPPAGMATPVALTIPVNFEIR